MSTKSNPHIILITDHLESNPLQSNSLYLTKPLGPQKVAHELRRAGYEVAILNHVHIYTFDELCHILGNLITDRTLFIGVSPGNYMSMDNVNAPVVSKEWGQMWRGKVLGAILPHGPEYNKTLKEFVKSHNPNTKWVVGGPDAVDLDYNRDYDFVVEGYADKSVVNLAQHLEQNKPLEKSHRSVFGFRVIRDPRAEGFDFVNSNMSWEYKDAILPDEVLSIEISRGCRFKCTFCAYPLNGRKKNDYIKDEQFLYQEFMSNYEKFGTTKYLFVDDTFNESPEKIDMVWHVSQRLPFQLKYWAYIRLDLVAAHKEQIVKLFESGLRGAFFGVETFNQKSAALIGKSGNRKKLVGCLQNIRDLYGRQITMHANFIAGLPYETLDSLIETRTWLAETDLIDSFTIMPLKLRSPDFIKTVDATFVSEIELNPEKFGYTLLDLEGGVVVGWRNEHMDYQIAKKICDELQQMTAGKQCLEGRRIFYASGLGIPLEELAGVPMNKIPWHKLVALKNERSIVMKKQVYTAHGIPPYAPASSA